MMWVTNYNNTITLTGQMLSNEEPTMFIMSSEIGFIDEEIVIFV